MAGRDRGKLFEAGGGDACGLAPWCCEDEKDKPAACQRQTQRTEQWPTELQSLTKPSCSELLLPPELRDVRLFERRAQGERPVATASVRLDGS